MLLSIIIPAYNVENYILNCLKSLHENIKRNDVEFIIVNDGSIDKTSEICHNYMINDNRFILINKKNEGVSSARNKGIDIAKGEYIFFLDGDDYVSNKFEESIFTCIDENLDFVFFDRWYKERNSVEYDYGKIVQNLNKRSNAIYEIIDVNNILLQKIFCSGSGEVLLKSNLIKQIRFDVKRSLLEDYDFFLNVIHYYKPKIYYCNKVVTIINDNVPNSLTRKIIPYKALPPFLSYTNTFLFANRKIQLKVFWIEVYFHLKKISFKERYFYGFKNKSFLFKNIQINKYFIGVMFFFLGIDVNYIRAHFFEIINKWKYIHI